MLISQLNTKQNNFLAKVRSKMVSEINELKMQQAALIILMHKNGTCS